MFSVSNTFGHSGLTTAAYEYQVYDIVSMTWLAAQYNFAKLSKANPYIAGQFLAENNVGMALIGTVHNYTTGGQFGATISHNLNLIVSYNGSPATAYLVPSSKCVGTLASPTVPSPGAIFGVLPTRLARRCPKVMSCVTAVESRRPTLTLIPAIRFTRPR